MRVCVRLISTRPGRAKVAKLAADLFPRERKYQINWNDFWWWVGTIIWHKRRRPVVARERLCPGRGSCAPPLAGHQPPRFWRCRGCEQRGQHR